MWGLRRAVSLLLDHGHPDAQNYPIGLLWDESLLVTERLKRSEVARVMLSQMAISALFSNDASKAFHELASTIMED